MKILIQNRWIYVASGISMTILLIFGMLYIIKSNDQIKYTDAVENTYKIISSINFFEKTLIEAEAAQRGYLLTGEINYKEDFELNLPLIDSSLNQIGILTKNRGQRIYFIQLSKFVNAKILIMKENLLLKGKEYNYFDNLRKGAFMMDNCRNYMGKIRSVEEALLQKRLDEKNKYLSLNLSFFKITVITSFVICIIAISVFFRELRIRLTAQKDLKAKIFELSNSKQELEEITFAASHDLQEPMRKVRVFSNLIYKKFAQKLSESDLEVIERINKITEQMQGLLNDLIAYTNLLNPNEKHTTINLYEVFEETTNKVFSDGNINLQISPYLGVIQGSRNQLEIMLVQIFENSLKFKNQQKELCLTVRYELKKISDTKRFWANSNAKHFHQITITDNGIGFDKQYNERIFSLFQRLHTHAEFPGKGIGLSLARRIMTNHNGFITCTGEKNVGASFVLHFPYEK